MNTTLLRALCSAALVVALFGVAVAKLPPPTEEQKAAAEAKKSKDAAAAAAEKQALTRVQDRVVARYIAEQKAKGITVTPQIEPTSTPAAPAARAAGGAPRNGAAAKK